MASNPAKAGVAQFIRAMCAAHDLAHTDGELLEQIGDVAARRLLTDLAQGAPQVGLTQDAQAALERLGR